MIGTTVRYRLSVDDIRRITEKRATPSDSGLGSSHTVGQLLPLIVTRLELDAGEGGRSINGQVLLDGSDQLWVTNVQPGDQPGEWSPIPPSGAAIQVEDLERVTALEQGLQRLNGAIVASVTEGVDRFASMRAETDSKHADVDRAIAALEGRLTDIQTTLNALQMAVTAAAAAPAREPVAAPE